MSGFGDLPYDEVLPPFVEDGLDDDELAATVDEFHADQEASTGAWKIGNDDVAEWAARKYLAATAERDRLVAQRSRWLRQIEDWYENASKEPTRTIDFFRFHLTDYAIRSRTSRKKTVNLPSLKLRTTEHPARVVVDNEDDFIEWAVNADEAAVRVRTEVAKDAIQNYPWKVIGVTARVVHPETGEVVPGLAVKDSFVSVSFT